MKLTPVQRAGQDRLLFGVCAGVARSFGVDALWVRVLFAVVLVLGGAVGLIVYAALALLLPGEPGPVLPWAARSPKALGVLVALAAVTVGLALIEFALPLSVLVPAALLAVGVALVWNQAMSVRGAEQEPEPLEIARLAGGLTLLVAGAVVLVIYSGEVEQASAALISAAGVAAGLGLIVGPRLVRARAEADAERRGRIRADERADVAARLHDSVLQTLALIQREDDPRRAQSLARRQERELRDWLYGHEQPGEAPTLATALRAAADDVEEHYGIAVNLVQPSDDPLDEGLSSLAAAAREAMTNAGRHAGVKEVSVLARVSDHEASVFIRDRGTGFELADVPGDRRGVRESIVGRMERSGGRASIASSPGAGTEVELVLPRKGA
ncbi:phage shock protein C (PspC) family protein [Solirubrobacter pauli]|uniref:Phage shock protein C (PspC) family protein n=1 Tax=Solirubrobacter pauli TaxID=166793 RepID=A0A660KZH0_9ACTN|nr:PspC domain-containing protein [Solirubrobacter pauli]RKQ86072.1 phage shock protein C (PspC) family protein [Solirubrobacter pauli]